MERLVEIIGEAANSLSEEFRARHPGIPWRDIIGCGSSSPTITTAWTLARCG